MASKQGTPKKDAVKSETTHDGVINGITLGSFELFDNLDAKVRDDIAGYFHIKKLVKGQYVISESQLNREVYFLVSGAVHACSFTENGKQVQFEELKPGMMFGELSAIDGKERSSDCIAATSVTLAVISAEDFQLLIDSYKSVRDNVIQRLAYMVRLHMRKLYELTTFPVPQRIRFELLRIASQREYNALRDTDSPSIMLASVPTHAEIASRIGTHREAVTRELKSLEGSGAITWRPGEYVIHDITQLTYGVSDPGSHV